jgi:hypothetical protein
MKVSTAAQADYAKNAYQATIASMALESQKLNQAGDMVLIDPARHYVQLIGVNQDPNTSISFDLINKLVYNLTVVPPATPESESAQNEVRMARLEQRLLAMEQRLAALENLTE